MSEARGVWLALGGNLGDRIAHLRAALDGLTAGGVAIDAVSSVYDTPPWGIEDQPRFANAAVGGRCSLTPHALLALCKRLEAAAGRDFAARPNSPRPLDVDILLLEGEMVSAPDLAVPHPRMLERPFVLVPLAEIAPELTHPATGAMRVLMAAADRSDIEVVEPPGWWERGTG